MSTTSMLDLIELSMGSGRDFEDMRVTGFVHPLNGRYVMEVNRKIKEDTSLRFYAKIIGFKRGEYGEKVGITNLLDYKDPKPTIKYKYRYKTKKELKIPNTLIEKILSKLGFYRKI